MKILTGILVIGGVILAISILMRTNVEDKGELNILPHEISGNKNSKIMLVFLHGYPNTMRMWDRLIESLKKGEHFMDKNAKT